MINVLDFVCVFERLMFLFFKIKKNTYNVMSGETLLVKIINKNIYLTFA